VRGPLGDLPGVALSFHIVFFIVGIILFSVGLYMAYLVFSSYWKSYKEATARAPTVAANGGSEEDE
ncbi:MAG: hypothetical protein GTO63_30920, partial [Anaerolineae bacterium]|nr:hypothetical protein [Anaerolineae bacterium]